MRSRKVKRYFVVFIIKAQPLASYPKSYLVNKNGSAAFLKTVSQRFQEELSTPFGKH